MNRDHTTGAGPAAGPLADAPSNLADTERTQILAALEQITLLGLKPTALESHLKELGLQRPR